MRGLYRWWSRPATPEIPSPAAGASTALAETPGWELTGIRFCHSNSLNPVFGVMSLRIEAGRMFVITGPSGSGKTTLINLLLGTLRPDRGSIELLLGREERISLTLGRDRLLRSVGFVGPDSFLIEGSVQENLFYGLSRAPASKEVWDALDQAGCAFVRDLPSGLDHLLDDQGQGLSAGEKQRLCLARALLRKPKVLVLDEPTAHLDKETEANVLTTLSCLKGRMTIIAATHQPSLLTIADSHPSLPGAGSTSRNSLAQLAGADLGGQAGATRWSAPVWNG